MPAHLYEPLGVTYIFAQQVGTVSAYSLGEFLPPDDDIEALKVTDRWLVIYVWFPVTMQLLCMLCLTFVVRYDSIKFLIVKGEYEEAIKHVKCVYKYADSDEAAKRFVESLRESSGENSSDITLKMALFDARYRAATWINLVHIVFHELTAINVINMFSNKIF